MSDWNFVVSMVEDFTQDVMMNFDIEEDEYDNIFESLTKDLYIYTLMVLWKFS